MCETGGMFGFTHLGPLPPSKRPARHEKGTNMTVHQHRVSAVVSVCALFLVRMALAGPDLDAPIAQCGPTEVIASSSPRGATFSPAVDLGRPVGVELGAPVPLSRSVARQADVSTGSALVSMQPAPASTQAAPVVSPLRQTSYREPSAEVFPRYVIRAQSPDIGPPPVPPPSDIPPSYNLPPLPQGGYDSGVVIDRPLNQSFWDRCQGWIKGCGGPDAFCSHCCDTTLISPVTNPFFFEDPRAISEIRPIFIYQSAPNSNPGYAGGNAEFFGLQARLALSESFSIVLNKLGGVAIQPDSGLPGFTDSTGFAEVNLGAKWTFYRNENSGTFAAAGLTFIIPAGSADVFQDTGTFGLDPYLSFGQTFGRSSFGTFNFLGSLGYAFSTDDERSEFFHTGLHLSYDVGSLRRFFPLIELNWFHYTDPGSARDLTFEGTDLFNYGSSALSDKNIFTVATGFRFNFTQNTQFGFGAEWVLTDRDASDRDFRMTFDMIFRW